MKAKASLTAPLFVLVLYGLLIASGYLEAKLQAAGDNPYLTVIILQILLFLIPAIVFCRLKGVGHAVKLNIRLFAPGKLGCTLVAGLTLICGSILIRFAQIHLFGMTSFSFSLFESFRPSVATDDFLFTTMAFAVMPALAEELIFRAILLTEYNESGLGAISSTVILSFLCSMMYFSLEQLPIRFLASVTFCLVTYVTGSSLAAFLSHLMFNIYGLFGESYIIDALTDPTNRIISLFTFALLFLILLIILLGECEHILRRMGQTGTPTPSYRLKKASDGKTPDIAATEASEDEDMKAPVMKESAKYGIEAFFSPTFLLCLLVYAIMIFGFI
ncbi:MAG: CPBP family intramembrane metalloprotease [Ruminococcaceae bacterium]|nr:CPBP family intramembrane metalloprotease [Oscillospiraceae bacterium]